MDSDTDDFFASPRSKQTHSYNSSSMKSELDDKSHHDNKCKKIQVDDKERTDDQSYAYCWQEEKGKGKELKSKFSYQNKESDKINSDSESSEYTSDEDKKVTQSVNDNFNSNVNFSETTGPEIHSKLKSNTNKKCSRSRSSSSSDSETDGDSDVTEVSPLHTPRTVSGISSQENRHERNTEIETERRKPPTNITIKRSRPTSASSSNTELSSKVQSLLNVEKNSLNLSLLEQAIIELDKGKQTRSVTNVLSADELANDINANPQRNYTFSNIRARDIDVENQRLMQRIVQHAKEAKDIKKRPKCFVQSKPIYHSAMRRKKDHQRIEEENLAFLKRLKAVKPCKDLRRDILLRDYDSKTIFGYSVAEAHESVQGRSRAGSAMSSTGRSSSRTQSSLDSYNTSASKSTSSTNAKLNSSVLADDDFDAQFVSKALARSSTKRPQSAHLKTAVNEQSSDQRIRPRSACVSSNKASSRDDLHSASSQSRVTWEEGW